MLLHSWCGSHLDWKKVVEELAKHFTVYAWDARGHGESQTTADGPYTLDQMADDFEDLLVSQNIRQPLVIAHSMGGSILWRYLERYCQENICKICTIDQPPKLLTDDDWDLGVYGNFTSLDNARFEKQMQEDFAESVLRLFAFGHNKVMRKKYEENSSAIIAARNYIKELEPEPLIAVWKDLVKADFRPLLEKLSVPTLLIYGEQSNYYGERLANYMQCSIVNSKMYLYKGADHSPHLRQPDRFIEDILEFMRPAREPSQSVGDG